MGIDIRDGQQLECITCALCIDACDNVMEKVGRERGLISYTTLANYNRNMALATGGVAGGAIDPSRVHTPGGGIVSKVSRFHLRDVIRPRTMIYTAIYALLGLGLLAALAMRTDLDVNVLADRNPQFVKLSDGSIRNGYQLKILNKTANPREFLVMINGLPGADLRLEGSDLDQGRLGQVTVEADQLRNVRTFVTLPPEAVTSGQTDFTFVVQPLDGGKTARQGAIFEAP
jgi:cytochrome c oxidase accessory protein FixG